MLLRFLLASFLLLQALAQNSVQTFEWKFRTDFVSTSLPACFEFDLIVFPNEKNATAGNFSGIPPYYMMAFPEGGQPTTTYIGNTNNSLSWTPTYPVGTKLILQMMDSTGSTGGTAGSIFDVVENPQGNDCIVASPPQNFTISSNITQGGGLETCQPWRLNINGGQPPYVIILDAKNSPVITNVTIPPSDDALVYINRADPGTVLFAGVVDGLGRWATGTQFVSTYGSTNYSCTGLGSVSTTQESLNEKEAALAAAKAAAKRRKTIIVAVVVPVVALLLIVGGVAYWLRKRKQRIPRFEDGVLDVTPRQFVDAGLPGQVVSVNSMGMSPHATPSPGKASFISPDSHGLPYIVEPYTDALSVDTTMMSSGSSSTQSPVTDSRSRSRPSFASFPTNSVRRSKAQEASDATSESNLTRNSIPSGYSGQSVWPQRSGSLGGNRMTASSMETEVIYQHRDAGQIVRELPPPYPPPGATNNSTTQPAESERTT